MDALAWLGQLVEWLASWIPRLVICRANHAGVKFVCGKKVKEIRPGLFMYWPITTEYELIPTARQTANLESQTVTTMDGRAVTVSVILIYRVVDPVKALVDSWEIDDTIGDVGLRATVTPLQHRSFDQIRDELGEQVQHEITKKARADLKPFGVHVESCSLTDCAETQVIRLLGGTVSVGASE